MRTILPVLGVFVLAVGWFGPLPDLATGSFAAHMTLHMAVVAVAAPLLALAVAGTRMDPTRYAPRLLAAIPASIVELIVVWMWHLPAMHHASRHETAIFVLEQASFITAGLWLWTSAAGGDGERRGAGVVALVFTSMHMTLLGALFALADRPLFMHTDASGTLGLAVVTDQQLGGAIMLLVGGASYLAGGLWLTAGLLRREAVS